MEQFMNYIFDIRDVIKRLEELEHLSSGYTFEKEFAEQDEKLYKEWREIVEFLNEVKDNGGDEQWRGDWYPLIFIFEYYFENYCIDLVKDCGDIPKKLPPYIERNINWSGVADDLKNDYTEIEINDRTYYYR